MTTAAGAGAGRLILFGRYPVPGETKTRLIPCLGALGAAEIQRRLTLKSLETLLQPHLPATTFCHGGGTRTKVRRWLKGKAVDFMAQRGDGLGARMRNAMFRVLKDGKGPVVLVGTDIPQMADHHIKTAMEALAGHDVVLGPSRDGGYWLVGLRQPRDIFSNIPWGTPTVLDQTLTAIRRQGLSVARLAMLDDIDTEADLRQWLPEPQWPRPYLSVVIPALNEAGAIRDTIEGLRSCECEIIVADGGSSDHTVAHARDAGAVAISTPRGRAIQQNRGAQIATGRVLLFLHADTRLPADFGHQVFDTLLAPDVAAGAFQFKTDYAHRQMRLLERTVRLRSTLLQMPYGDQGLFMSRAMFEKAGGFDPVPIAEDLYLVRRLARMGRIVLAPGAAITSGRRWQALGIWRTTLMNYLIAGGCLLGIAPDRLAPLYKLGINQKNRPVNLKTNRGA